MPRWIIIVLVVVGVAWLAGVGLQVFGADEGEPKTRDVQTKAKHWFGSLATLMPEPKALTAADVELSAACGSFPELQARSSTPCRVVVREDRGRRATHVELTSGRADLEVQAARGRPTRQELTEKVEIQFGDDGGAFSVHCLGKDTDCAVHLGD
jgi:hypothetical protein